jgi:hypothetical protein
MRDWIITILSVSVSLMALSLMALFFTKVRNHPYVNRYLVIVTIYTAIATIGILAVWNGMKP